MVKVSSRLAFRTRQAVRTASEELPRRTPRLVCSCLAGRGKLRGAGHFEALDAELNDVLTAAASAVPGTQFVCRGRSGWIGLAEAQSATPQGIYEARLCYFERFRVNWQANDWRRRAERSFPIRLKAQAGMRATIRSF